MSDGHWFTYHGEEIPPFYHMYNMTWLNERMVEVAIAQRWLQGRDSRAGLEVGNVLGHYSACGHQVIDLYEERSWYQDGQLVYNVSVFEAHEHVDPKPWVLSISTVEHTGSPVAAIDCLRGLVAPGGSLLVTFPTGVDPDLDALVESWVLEPARLASERACTVAREHNDHGGWVETERPEVRPYGPWANSVAVLEWEAPL